MSWLMDKLRKRYLRRACMNVTLQREQGEFTNRHFYFITMMESRGGHLQKFPVSTSLEHLAPLPSVPGHSDIEG
jgi:hypothetical protein